MKNSIFHTVPFIVIAILFIICILLPGSTHALTVSNYALTETGYGLTGIYWPGDPRPWYVEDYYLYYWRRINDRPKAMKMGIVILQYALNSPFRHPSQALAPIQTKEQHLKYKYLMRMQIYLLIVKNYLRLGSRYDMPTERMYYYHRDFYPNLKTSLQAAGYYYEHAQAYWPYVMQYAELAAAYEDLSWHYNSSDGTFESFDVNPNSVYVDLDRIEDAQSCIVRRAIDWDYEDIITERLDNVARNIAWLERENK